MAAAVTETEVVSVFLMHDGRILLLRRGENRWQAPTALLRESARQTADAILASQTGLAPAAAKLVAEGAPLTVLDRAEGNRRRIHPFLFTIGDGGAVRLASSEIRRRWVWPGEIAALDTAPGLADALRRVYR